MTLKGVLHPREYVLNSLRIAFVLSFAKYVVGLIFNFHKDRRRHTYIHEIEYVLTEDCRNRTPVSKMTSTHHTTSPSPVHRLCTIGIQGERDVTSYYLSFHFNTHIPHTNHESISSSNTRLHSLHRSCLFAVVFDSSTANVTQSKSTRFLHKEE